MTFSATGNEIKKQSLLCNPICGPPVRAASVCQRQQGEQRVAWLARGRRFSSSTPPSVRPLFLPISATTLTPTAPGAAAAAVEGEHTVGDATERASELLPQLTLQVTDHRPTDWPRSRGPDRRTDRLAGVGLWLVPPSFPMS